MKRQAALNWKSGLFVALIACVLGACNQEQDNLNRYIAEVRARPAAPIPPIPAVRTYTPFVYDGLAGRDPFRASTSEGSDEAAVGPKGNGPHPDLQRTREYLERFELDTLTMVGTFAKESLTRLKKLGLHFPKSLKTKSDSEIRTMLMELDVL